MKRDFLSIKDFSSSEIQELFELAKELKVKRYNPEKLKGISCALIFEKPSLRTRVTFEIGIYELGGKAIYLSSQDIGLGKREAIKDVASNLSRWVGLIIARTFSHNTIVELAKYASCPVINALSDLEHPCQALTDLFTIYEKRGGLKNVNLSYIGDGNNVCRSLMLGANIMGMNMKVATPKGYEPKTKCKMQNAKCKIVNNPKEAVKDADIIYTDVWASMGQEAEREKRERIFKDFQINSQLLKFAKPDVLIMHCLPAHRGKEITDEIIDGKRSIVLDQAENRLHIQKAIMIKLFV